MRVFRHDVFAFIKPETFAGDIDPLICHAHEAHFDPRFFFIVNRFVPEHSQIEIRIVFAVQTILKIQIKIRCYSGRVIVGWLQYFFWFLKVDTDQ